MSFVLLGILNSQAASGAIVFDAVAGYAIGGNEGGSALQVINKFAFPSDSRSSSLFGLSIKRQSGAGFENPNTAGYAAGGSGDGGSLSSVSKITFPTDSTSTITSLSAAKYSIAGFSNGNVAGYAAGGVSATTVVEKYTFPAESRSTLSTGLTTNTSSATGFGDRFVAGYVAGNEPATTTVNKFTFPADTRTTLATGLSTGRYSGAGFANPAVAGYVAGGAFYSGSNVPVTTVDKFAFPSDSRSTLGTGLATAVSKTDGFANPEVAGYATGGETSGSPFRTSQVSKFAFPSDTRSTTTSLSGSRRAVIGFQDA